MTCIDHYIESVQHQCYMQQKKLGSLIICSPVSLLPISAHSPHLTSTKRSALKYLLTLFLPPPLTSRPGADPSMKVRADIAGRYVNRYFTYEPADISLCEWFSQPRLVFFKGRTAVFVYANICILYYCFHKRLTKWLTYRGENKIVNQWNWTRNL